ncbi:hypothetical protein TNCV_1397681, partial [Trichonephila clavipes]
MLTLSKHHVTQNNFCSDEAWITIRPLVLVTPRAVDFVAGGWLGIFYSRFAVGWIKRGQ